MDTLVNYTISPKKYPGVKTIQKSALEDILGVLRAILGDHLHHHEIKTDCVAISVDAVFMEGIIKRSNLHNSCEIRKKQG